MFLELLGLHNFIFYLIEFCIAASIVLLAGKKLTVYGDQIASGSKFSHSWIGFILLAAITSLPELMTGISATGIVGSVDLMAGDVIGSNAVNITILAAMFFFINKSIEDKKNKNLTVMIEELTAGFAGLLLAAIVGIFIIAKVKINTVNTITSIIFSIILFLFYLIIIYITFKISGLKGEEEEIIEIDKKRVIPKFLIFSLIIVGASIWMTKTADMISETPITVFNTEIILGKTFVGALLLALATSLPEMSVTFNCARIGNVSMAVGNIFGSNIFNIFIIPVSSLFYRGTFWNDISFDNIYLIFLVFFVTNVMAMDLIIRSKTGKKGISILNIATIVAWIGGLGFILVAR